MNIKILREKYRAKILKIAEKYKAEDVRIFGSTVRGDNIEGSDVDFLVHFQEGASLLDEAGLDLELRELLGCKIDLISDRAIRSEFRTFILKEAESL